MIDCFKKFSYSKVNTLIRSRNLVNVIFSFDLYSFVIKIAIDVNRAVLDDLIKPALGFNIATVLELIVEADTIQISVIINNIFFLFELLSFFLYYLLSILRDFKILL